MDERLMAMKGVTRFAVDGCAMPIRGPNNLCDEHRLAGMGAKRVAFPEFQDPFAEKDKKRLKSDGD